MKQTISLLSGDGIGPEVAAAAQRVISAACRTIEWEPQSIGSERGLPSETLDSIKRNRVALKGPTETPAGRGHRSHNVTLREALDLYLNIRPACSLPSVRSRYADVPIDIVVFRENVEDCYSGEEWEFKDTAKSIASFSIDGVRRFAAKAIEYMNEHDRSRLTIVHKANILKLTHGMFLHQAYDVAQRAWGGPGLSVRDLDVVNDLIADNALLQLIMRPERFDCLLLPNFLGDLFSDACAALVGGLGVAPGANIGDEYAVFEAVHGTAPDIAGKGIANPTSLILSGAMMLDHVGESEAAERVRDAVHAVYHQGSHLTKDIVGAVGVSTDAFTDAVVAEIEK